MRGGYKLINLKNKSFTLGTEQTIDGIYDSIESNYHKPLIITGLVVSGVEQTDLHVGSAIVDGTDYVLTCGDYKIVVADDDGVTITQISEQ